MKCLLGELYYKINWDFVSVVLDLINYLVIIIVGVATFLYFKIKRLKIIIINDDGGKDIIIQNITNNAVFIKDLNIIIKGKNSKKRRTISYKEFAHDLPNDIPPKGYYKISMDYCVLDIKKSDTVMIKVDIYSHYSYRRKVK